MRLRHRKLVTISIKYRTPTDVLKPAIATNGHDSSWTFYGISP